ncbi:MAG: hypothetical protein IJV25_08585 [Prevotella sp.]|nr:hypothetical protein [Prevotella sp.]
MKKILLSATIIFCCLTIHAQEANDTLVSLAKVDWKGYSGELGELLFFADSPNPGDKARLEILDEGLGIYNDRMRENIYTPMVALLSGELTLQEHHNYVVRITMKVPSDGSYWVCLGNWDGSFLCVVPAKAKDEFQIIDVDYPEYGNNVIGNAFVLLGCGWVPGTTIIKEVEVLERVSGSGIQRVKSAKAPDVAIYNLSGQKVDASYKGVVIQNGKKRIMH